jgi:hypothetical protein
MEIIEDHRSPDRFLRLIVTRDDDGDVSIGFDKYAWHTHGDIEASLPGLPEPDAVRKVVNRIINDEQVIVVSRINDAVQDIWPTDDPQGEFKYKPPEESLEFRLWSGVIVEVSAG